MTEFEINNISSHTMFPSTSRNMDDSAGDINKLFQKPTSIDGDTFYYTSPYQMANRSSSSADSMSPDSYFESFRQSDVRSDTPLRYGLPSLERTLQFNRTPECDVSNIFDRFDIRLDVQAQDFVPLPRVNSFQVRRHRPIMGRRIFDNQPKPELTKDEIENIWQNPNVDKSYELFPSENRGYEFQTPLKTTFDIPSRSPISSSQVNIPKIPNFAQFSPIASSSSDGRSKICTFCRKNGERPYVYMTHAVKEKVGNRNVVTCPILRSHVCGTCGATKDDAHTITYCPVLRSNNNGIPLQSTTITLKNTRIKSNGRRRY